MNPARKPLIGHLVPHRPPGLVGFPPFSVVRGETQVRLTLQIGWLHLDLKLDPYDETPESGDVTTQLVVTTETTEPEPDSFGFQAR